MSSTGILKPAPAHRMLTLEDGRRLSAWLWPGRGAPVVLLHGLLDCGRGWDALARSTKRPCVAVDLPGFGQSDLPMRPRISAYTDDVVAGLRKLGVDQCALVGHSLGGAIATSVCERGSVEVTGLVLLAPAGFGRIPLAELVGVPGVRELTGKLLPFALSSSLAVNVAYSTMVTHRSRIEEATFARVKARARQALPGARTATMAVVAAGGSASDAFHRRSIAFQGPVTAVWGDHDRIVPREHAAGVRRAFPQANIELWPGIGHHPQRECPEQLHRLVHMACRRVQSARRSDAVPLAGAA
jgi:pyruvate dehydrogenase E2 component (dihydrolipoamide acetyltransferase)